jgi:N-acetylmuramoyl-L-alanine amidase
MPSVLVELGFISNKEEERYMSSNEGQNQLARSLYNAFTKYKREYDRKQGALSNGAVTNARPVELTESTPQETPAERENSTVNKTDKSERNTSGKLIYKIQILTSDKKLSESSRLFKGYKNIDSYKEGGLIKYTYGETTSFEEIKKLRRKVAKDFKDAFIIAFKDGKKVKY